jgi:hypothetical protein
MKTTKQLQTERKKVFKQLQAIDDEIEKIELRAMLPNLRKKYEGKYWKYKNHTSDSCHWWLYSFCKKVNDDRRGIFDRFQMTKRNDCENDFRYDKEDYLHLCQIEITKEEYLKALNKMQLELMKLNH